MIMKIDNNSFLIQIISQVHKEDDANVDNANVLNLTQVLIVDNSNAVYKRGELVNRTK